MPKTKTQREIQDVISELYAKRKLVTPDEFFSASKPMNPKKIVFLPEETVRKILQIAIDQIPGFEEKKVAKNQHIGGGAVDSVLEQIMQMRSTDYVNEVLYCETYNTPDGEFKRLVKIYIPKF